jgi:energy-coupling factor transporter transmembrane protein EcfT
LSINNTEDVYLVYSNLSTGTSDWLDGSEMMQTLYLTPNITNMVHTLAHYMKVALRSINTFEDYQTNLLNGTGLPKDYISPKERVAGRVFVDVIHVRVRWPWLILPALLMSLAFTLLVATILQTRGEKIGT